MHISEYLKPTRFIESDAPSIKKTAQLIAGDKKDVPEIAKALFYFIRDEIKYSVYVPKLREQDNKATEVLRRRKGYCVQKAVLLVALARASGIPARLRFADIINFKVPEHILKMRKGDRLFVYHGYAELFIEGKWVKVAPVFNLNICKKHGIIPVEFDGRNDAILPEKDIYGNPYIKYVKDRGSFIDLPLDEIIRERKRLQKVADFYEELMKEKEGCYGN